MKLNNLFEPKTKTYITIRISHKWLLKRFAKCDVDFITNVCHGRCCHGNGSKVLVSVLPKEETPFKDSDISFVNGKISAVGKCPFQNQNGLCDLHFTEHKFFGCIISPFKINNNDTLILRHRYISLPCSLAFHKDLKDTDYVYKVFSASLIKLFGEDGYAEICEKMNDGNVTEDFYMKLNLDLYNNLKFLERVKQNDAE